jgi:hypothetical protein
LTALSSVKLLYIQPNFTLFRHEGSDSIPTFPANKFNVSVNTCRLLANRHSDVVLTHSHILDKRNLTLRADRLFVVQYLQTLSDSQPEAIKAIPLQAWTGPEGSRRPKLPDFKTIST